MHYWEANEIINVGVGVGGKERSKRIGPRLSLKGPNYVLRKGNGLKPSMLAQRLRELAQRRPVWKQIII